MLSKKTLGFLLKITIVVFALYFLYQQLTSKKAIEGFDIAFIKQTILENQSLVVLVFLMMFFNWLVEAIKWKFLIAKIEKVSMLTSLRAVFSGITVSVFTPNRIGEYGGRVFCLEKADRMQGVLITVLGSMAQLLTTIFFGSMGILFLNNYIPELQELYQEMEYTFPLMLFMLLLLNILLLLLFHNISVISNLMDKYGWLSKYKKYKEVFTFYNTQELAFVFLFSIIRYAIFTTQFFILLNLFGVDISYFDSIILTMVMLFIISIIPTIAISEIGIRGSVSVYLFGLVSANTLGILSATFVLWVINLLLPAIIGAFFVFTLKFFRKP
tara:strand:+ start:534 stop:1514 length:981 start_codon:yes stop_codon:yes gene_type:complete